MQLSERLLSSGSQHTRELGERIQLKHDLLQADDPAHKDIRTSLIIFAGAMRGIFAGGVVIGLQQLGLTKAFDEVIGISAGAATAAYFLSGQAVLGTTIYSEELASKQFIDPRRRNNILNVGYLREVFEDIKPLDQDAIRSNRARFHIGVTNLDEAKPEYVEVAHNPDNDIIEFIQASSSVPGLAPPMRIGDTLYGDGITTCRNPIRYALEELGATDVLCIVNQPLRVHRSAPLSDRAISAVLTRDYGKDIRAAYRNRHHMSDETASTEYPEDRRIGILCPESKPVGRLSKDVERLKKVAQLATERTVSLLQK